MAPPAQSVTDEPPPQQDPTPSSSFAFDSEYMEEGGEESEEVDDPEVDPAAKGMLCTKCGAQPSEGARNSLQIVPCAWSSRPFRPTRS